jgi:hypothetical protein
MSAPNTRSWTETILGAASRARTLTVDLERSNRAEDRNQVAAGVRHELDTILQAAHSLQAAAREAAAGNHAGKVRLDAPATSRRAATAITMKTGTARWDILECLWLAGCDEARGWGLRYRGGMTDLELQRQLSMNPSTERPRRGELVDAGLVREHGTRRQDGSDWTVWALTQAGADTYRERIPGPRRIVTPAGDPTLF